MSGDDIRAAIAVITTWIRRMAQRAALPARLVSRTVVAGGDQWTVHLNYN